jgi:hypothetical protein
VSDEAYKRRDIHESCTCGWSTWSLAEIDVLRARLARRDELLRHLSRVVVAGIFGIPWQEAGRLRDEINGVLRDDEGRDDAQETGD